MLAMKLPRITPSMGAVVYPNEVISLILLKVPVVLGFELFFFLSTIVSSKIIDEILYTISSIIFHIISRVSDVGRLPFFEL